MNEKEEIGSVQYGDGPIDVYTHTAQVQTDLGNFHTISRPEQGGLGGDKGYEYGVDFLRKELVEVSLEEDSHGNEVVQEKFDKEEPKVDHESEESIEDIDQDIKSYVEKEYENKQLLMEIKSKEEYLNLLIQKNIELRNTLYAYEASKQLEKEQTQRLSQELLIEQQTEKSFLLEIKRVGY